MRQQIDVGGDGCARVRHLIVAAALALGHHRVKTLAIEVGGNYFMAALLQGRDDCPEQRIVIALRQWMAVNDLEEHGGDQIAGTGLELLGDTSASRLNC